MGGYLELDGADGKAVAHSHVAALDAPDGQVLTEQARLKAATKLVGPELVVVGEIDIDGLVGSTMVLAVADRVVSEPRGVDHRALHGALDAAGEWPVSGNMLGGADVDAEEAAHAQCSREAK